ncbi:MAG: hypothetical protein MJK14_09190 [Rivularia sp. ALOHA_DT_140]|nr:hypothetical protein [Rivularia sp. ALOHA_DT_140]
MKDIFDNLIVVGASRGIGAAVAEHLISRTNRLISVSRTPSTFGEWIKADISTKQGIEIVSNAVGNCVLDGLLYRTHLGSSSQLSSLIPIWVS